MAGIPIADTWTEMAVSRLRAAADQIAATPNPTHLGDKRLSFRRLAVDAEAAVSNLTADERIPRDRCLYVLRLDETTDPAIIKQAYVKAKKRPDLKLPQDNNGTSSTLYVGSSCATGKRVRTLRSRLRQHLIKAPTATYALQLAQWTSHLEGAIIVSAWQYPAMGEGEPGDLVARQAVLAMEDWLAGELKPMLGRRGSRH